MTSRPRCAPSGGSTTTSSRRWWRRASLPGLFRGDISADVVVHYFLSVVNQLGSWYKPDGSLSPAQVGDLYAQLLIGGLAAR